MSGTMQSPPMSSSNVRALIPPTSGGKGSPGVVLPVSGDVAGMTRDVVPSIGEPVATVVSTITVVTVVVGDTVVTVVVGDTVVAVVVGGTVVAVVVGGMVVWVGVGVVVSKTMMTRGMTVVSPDRTCTWLLQGL